jgi:acyl-coenzyme A thioesterase PaaI-like protein
VSDPDDLSFGAVLARGLDEGELTPRRAELFRIAGEVRTIMDRLVSTTASDEELGAAADALAVVAGMFTSLPSGSAYEGFAEAANSGGSMGHFDHSPMLGGANPLAPPLRLRAIDDRTIEGDVIFGAAYEGPPGCVHGGFVAAAFDEILGCTQSLSGSPGMTGRLIVNYRSPTPLHTPLRFVTTWDRTEGRKVFTSGSLFAGDRLCAEAEGLFISIDFERFRSLKDARDG